MADARQNCRASNDPNAPAELWRLDANGKLRVTWFERCRPKRILATNALLVVEVERTTASWTSEYQEPLKQELRKLARGVAHAAWDCGLQRPVVLACVEEDKSVRRWLTKLVADQEWHRGEFTLWPFDDAKGIDWLLQLRVEALQQSEEDRARPEDDREAIERFAKGQSDELGWLVRELNQVMALRQADAGREFTDRDKQSFNRPIDRWIDSALQRAQREAPDHEPSLTGQLHVPLVLTSYDSGQEGGLHFPAEASEADRKDWCSQSIASLRALRARVSQQQPPVIEIVPQCTPAVAMYVGSVFHAAAGISLRVRQHNQKTGQNEVWQRTPGRAVDPARLEISSRSTGGEPEELCVLISVTQDVTSDADRWMSESAKPRAILQLALPELGSTVVKDGDEAYPIALAVRREVIRARRDLTKRVPLRVFYAGPVALAVFIGAQLNAMGDVYLMDFDKAVPGYVESFHLTPGA